MLYRTERKRIEKCREKNKLVQQSFLPVPHFLIRKYTSEKFFENVANEKGNREEITERLSKRRYSIEMCVYLPCRYCECNEYRAKGWQRVNIEVLSSNNLLHIYTSPCMTWYVICLIFVIIEILFFLLYDVFLLEISWSIFTFVPFTFRFCWLIIMRKGPDNHHCNAIFNVNRKY